jgi:hypothetical protein
MLAIHSVFIVLVTADAGKIFIIGTLMTVRTVQVAVISRIDGKGMNENCLRPCYMVFKMTILAIG